jgi:chemotaxis family two-component system response regulator Rcp1
MNMQSDETLEILPDAEVKQPDDLFRVWEGDPSLSLPAMELLKAYDFEALADLEQEPAVEIRMEILLVDDNPGDVRIVMMGLKEALPAATLNVVGDGVEAMQFLRKEGKHSKAPRPDIILLDLRLPKKSGFDVLAEIKQDPKFLNIPVVVQSSSDAPIDIHRAYGLHANCYITKPTGLDEFSRTMRILAEFWVSVAKLPDGGNQWRKN